MGDCCLDRTKTNGVPIMESREIMLQKMKEKETVGRLSGTPPI